MCCDTGTCSGVGGSEATPAAPGAEVDRGTEGKALSGAEIFYARLLPALEACPPCELCFAKVLGLDAECGRSGVMASKKACMAAHGTVRAVRFP